MIDGKNRFDHPIKSNKVTYSNIRKIATCKGDDYWLFIKLYLLQRYL